MNKHNIFVYGTLKTGFSSNSRLLGTADKLADAKTAPTFTMVSLGGFPGVIPQGATTIIGEVYKVSDEILSELDMYEGHPTFYKREEINVEGIDDKCWIYLLPNSYLNTRETIITGEW